MAGRRKEEGGLHIPESLQLIESREVVTGFVFLSSPDPDKLVFPGTVIERNVEDNSKQTVSDMSIEEAADQLAMDNEWGIAVLKKRVGKILIGRDVADFSTGSRQESQTAFFVNDKDSVRTIQSLLSENYMSRWNNWTSKYLYPTYEDGQLRGMVDAGIVGLLTTRTGKQMPYKTGDSIIYRNEAGFHQEVL